MTAKQVLALRKRLKLTQLQFAIKLKVQPVSISRWERGVTHPDITSVRRMERLAKRMAKQARERQEV